MGSIQKNIDQLREFRKRFGANLSSSHIENIFGIKGGEDGIKEIPNSIWSAKLEIALRFVKYMKVLDWVRFIAVTGSVGAESAKDDDDIDILIVVKNDRMWLYRGLMMINPWLYRNIRKEGITNVKNRLCINLVVEERGLNFDSDLFNFHELYFMKPIYNDEYKENILRKNGWVREFGGVVRSSNVTVEGSESAGNIVLSVINYLAYLSQVIFMIICKHNPDLNRIRRNNKVGRIEFFPVDFKRKVLKHV